MFKVIDYASSFPNVLKQKLPQCFHFFSLLTSYIAWRLVQGCFHACIIYLQNYPYMVPLVNVLEPLIKCHQAQQPTEVTISSTAANTNNGLSDETPINANGEISDLEGVDVDNLMEIFRSSPTSPSIIAQILSPSKSPPPASQTELLDMELGHGNLDIPTGGCTSAVETAQEHTATAMIDNTWSANIFQTQSEYVLSNQHLASSSMVGNMSSQKRFENVSMVECSSSHSVGYIENTYAISEHPSLYNQSDQTTAASMRIAVNTESSITKHTSM